MAKRPHSVGPEVTGALICPPRQRDGAPLGWPRQRNLRQGGLYEQRSSPGGHREGRVHPHVGRQARELAIEGPFFGGWEMYHVKGSPVDPNRIYASPVDRLVRPAHPALRRRRQDLEPVGNQFAYDGVTGTHQWYDGTPHPWEFARVWHLEPSLTDPDTVLAGVEDAALFRSTDGGQTWSELPGCARTGPARMAAGRGRDVPAHDHRRPQRPQPDPRRHLARPGVFRTDDGGATWAPDEQGALDRARSPTPTPTRATACTASPCTRRARTPSSCRSTGTSCAATTAATTGPRSAGNLPTDFGFAIDVHAHEPETVYVVPITSDSEHFPPEGKLRVYRSRTGGNEWEPLTKGLPQANCYVDVLRDAMAVDSLDSCGVYFGTTGGQVYASADAGDSWQRHRPATCRRVCRWRSRRWHDPRRPAGAPEGARPRRRRGRGRRPRPPPTDRADALEATHPTLHRDHPRPGDPAAPPLHALLRLRGGPLLRDPTPAARGGRRGRASPSS